MFANDIPMGGGNGGISGKFVSGLCRDAGNETVKTPHVPQTRYSYGDFLESCHARRNEKG
jgi:hypothetical protein